MPAIDDNERMTHAQIEQWQRVRMRETHQLRGKVVALRDEGNMVDVRFDGQPEQVHPVHVDELEAEDDPCGCVFCINELIRRRAASDPST